MITLNGRIRKSTRKAVLFEDKENEVRGWIPKFAISSMKEIGAGSMYGIAPDVEITMPDDYYEEFGPHIPKELE